MLTKISGSKDNEAMKRGQLIEYNSTNIFLEKSYVWWRNYPQTLFLKIRIEHISGSIV